MAKPEGQHKETPSVAMRGEGLDAKPPETKWSLMENAPQDGQPVFLRAEGGEAVECYWRTTRQYRKSSWQEVSFWTIFGQNPSPITWKPTGWWREDKKITANAS